MNNSLICVICTLLNMEHTYLLHPCMHVPTYVTPAFVYKPRIATNDPEEPAIGSSLGNCCSSAELCSVHRVVNPSMSVHGLLQALNTCRSARCSCILLLHH